MSLALLFSIFLFTFEIVQCRACEKPQWSFTYCIPQVPNKRPWASKKEDNERRNQLCNVGCVSLVVTYILDYQKRRRHIFLKRNKKRHIFLKMEGYALLGSYVFFFFFLIPFWVLTWDNTFLLSYGYYIWHQVYRDRCFAQVCVRNRKYSDFIFATQVR